MNWELHFWCAKHPLYKQLRDLKSLSLGQPVPDVLVGVARVSGKTVEQLNLGRWGNRSFRVEHSESDTRSLLIAQGLGTLAMLPENSPEAPLPFPIVAIGVGFVSLLLWPYSPMSYAPFWARRWRAVLKNGGSKNSLVPSCFLAEFSTRMTRMADRREVQLAMAFMCCLTLLRSSLSPSSETLCSGLLLCPWQPSSQPQPGHTWNVCP